MDSGQIVELSRRGVVAVSGADAEAFLNDIVTCNVPAADGGAAYGALLTPQGKVLFDFIVFRHGGRFLFDLPRSQVADFIKRLTLYRLRAKVDFADLSDDHIVIAAWGGTTAPILDGPVAPDPRLPALGFRAIVPSGADMAADYVEASAADYDSHRVALGIAEGGVDFASGDTYPHDSGMDQLGGVDFAKGCYIGQEVVSRMEHRGTARRRFVIATGAAPLPASGTEIAASGRAIGTMASSANGAGLALVRLDRAKDAMDAGAPITAGIAPIALTLPAWARYTWPDTVAEADGA
jgi:folate-binding protein YgfZ